MSNINWKRINPLRESNIIKTFEEDYKIILPDYLKELIMINNGGSPSLDMIKTVDGMEVEIKSLLSYNKEDIENIYNVIDYFKNEFNNKILPIATEPSGDYFCIDLTNDCVVYWDHETDEISLISNKFNEFLDNLYKK